MDDESSITTGVEEPVARARRARVLLGGYAAFNQEHSAVPCIIRDLSETGARVQFDLGWIVPSHFVLFVDLEGFKVECEKVWHQGKLYGLRFTGPRIATDRARHQHIDLFNNDQKAPSETVANGPDRTPGRKVNRPAFGKLR